MGAKARTTEQADTSAYQGVGYDEKEGLRSEYQGVGYDEQEGLRSEYQEFGYEEGLRRARAALESGRKFGQNEEDDELLIGEVFRPEIENPELNKLIINGLLEKFGDDPIKGEKLFQLLKDIYNNYIMFYNSSQRVEDDELKQKRLRRAYGGAKSKPSSEGLADDTDVSMYNFGTIMSEISEVMTSADEMRKIDNVMEIIMKKVKVPT